MSAPFYDARQVAALLDYPGCTAAMREAMAALSASDCAQPFRQIVDLGDRKLFGLMPGNLPAREVFGAKLVSVFPDPVDASRSRHQGVVVVFEVGTGAVACLADAETVTLIRTACATAAATAVLARPDARVLAVFGAGAQAISHIRAISAARPLDAVLLWGRSFERAQRAAEELERCDVAATPVADPREAAGAADIICTVTSSAQPVLLGRWIRPGAHVNLVGSSYLGPVEVDSDLVARARYFADYRAGVLAQASELAVARDAGIVDDEHVVGEIGEVFNGDLVGRQSPEQITVYKSLGHVVQDLAAAAYVHARAIQGEAPA